MDLAVVIVNWNGRDLLARCLNSIAETASNLACEVWVVDNGSTDGSSAMVREQFPWVRLVASEQNLGFAGGNNLALRIILGLEVRASEVGGRFPVLPSQPPEYLLLLNPDTVVQPGAFQALLGFMRRNPHVGVSGALLLNEDRSFQASYVPFPTLRQEFLILSGLGRKRYGEAYPSAGVQQSRVSRDNVDYVVGACMLARTQAVHEVGLLDEGFFMYSEEVDWCYRFRAAGWAVGYCADALIVHLGGASTRQVRPQMLAELYHSRVRFLRKHYGPSAALGLRALLVAMNGSKLIRATLRRNSTTGTPPLSWSLLRRAISSTE